MPLTTDLTDSLTQSLTGPLTGSPDSDGAFNIITVGRQIEKLFTLWGLSATFGSIAPTTATWDKGAGTETVTLVAMFWNTSGGPVAIEATRTSVINEGWTTVEIDGNLFTRTDFTFAAPSQWTLAAQSNPFGTVVGAEKDVNWVIEN